VLGVALAAATGFRVFLPMFIVSGPAYTGHLHLDDGFAWRGTPSTLIVLSVAAVAEVLAYYIPVVDNPLDTLATPPLSSPGGSVGGRHDRCATDGGRDGRRRHRRTDTRNDPESALDRPDGRPRQPRYFDYAAWRRSPDILSGAGRACRRDRAGRAFHVGCAARGAPVFSRSKSPGAGRRACL
jgi:Domain of unknown function (DUF4126)